MSTQRFEPTWRKNVSFVCFKERQERLLRQTRTYQSLGITVVLRHWRSGPSTAPALKAKTGKTNSWTFCVAATVMIAVAFSGRLAGQTAAVKSSGESSGSSTQWSVQVERIDSGDLGLAHSFQIATYENLLEELNKTKRFKYVLREGDRKASEIPDSLILKTMVVKYTPGSETQRAVTTVSGATKLTVRSQLITRDGQIVLDRTVRGNVRFFGSNLRATHNLARNVAKVIRQSAWLGSERLARCSSVNSDCERHRSPGF